MTDLATPFPDSDPAPALIVGAGPAGLMAAETLCARGHRVEIVEAKPSAGRKLLMAGRSGLNLTNAGPADRLRETYAEAAPWLSPMLESTHHALNFTMKLYLFCSNITKLVHIG